jgi:hypothetical protein
VPSLTAKHDTYIRTYMYTLNCHTNTYITGRYIHHVYIHIYIHTESARVHTYITHTYIH